MIKQTLKSRFANKFPRLSAYILKLLRGGPSFTETGGLWRIKDHTGCIYIPYIRRYGMYCNTVRKRIDNMLERYPAGDLENALVLDIGAHIGEFAIAASQYAGKVICFEPDPAARSALIKNTAEINNIEVRPIALSNRTGKTKFYVATEHADSSLFRPEVFTESIEIDAFRLDDLSISVEQYKRVVLKMDAEGFEPEVLEGGLKWIKSNLQLAAIDVAPERAGSDTYREVKSILESAGFKETILTKDMVLVMEGV